MDVPEFQIQITNDVNSFTVADLNTIYYGRPTPPAGTPEVQGITRQGSLATKYFLGIGYGYKTFSLSTNYSGSDLAPSDMLATQIHELGHSLGQTLHPELLNTEDKYAGQLGDCFNHEMVCCSK